MANVKQFCKTVVDNCPYCKTGTYKKPAARKKRRDLKKDLKREINE